MRNYYSMADCVNWTILWFHDIDHRVWILILWMNAERSKFLSFWECECSRWWWRAEISDRVCVRGSDDKLLRDNQTISPDGEEGQSEDIMNCQYREREALSGIAYLSYYFGSIHWEEITGSSATDGSQAKSGPSLNSIQPSDLILMKHWTSEHFSAENSLASSEALSGQLAIRGAKFGLERGHLSLFWP